MLGELVDHFLGRRLALHLAKEAGEEFKRKQAEVLENAASKSDIIICTALIPGKKAPRIINENMIKNMQRRPVARKVSKMDA